VIAQEERLSGCLLILLKRVIISPKRALVKYISKSGGGLWMYDFVQRDPLHAMTFN
jgi:hypothetical protein